MRRFCIHHAWYGEGKAWKNMSQSQMASKLLEEIGGCKQEYDFCKAFVPKVVVCTYLHDRLRSFGRR